MGRETSVERRRRSRSPNDHDGRNNRERSHDRRTRENGRDGTRGSFRERQEDRERWRHHAEQDSRYGEEERGRRGGRDDRDRERHGRQHGRSEERRQRRSPDTQCANPDTQALKKDSATTEKRSSRWGNAVPPGNAANGESGFENHAFQHGDRSGGTYGPADRGWGGGAGGRGQGNGATRDESWVEHRLKLRAEARPPRGVWNRSPSPPKRKEPKIIKAPVEVARKTTGKGREKERGAKQVARRGSGAKRSGKKGDRVKPRHKRPPSVTSSSSDSGSSNSSSSSSNSSSSSSSSDSSEGESSSEEEEHERRKSAKRNKRASVALTDQYEPKVARPASPASPGVEAIEAAVEAVGDGTRVDVMPHGELDELDAAEAAQFKADVQGHHRQNEAKDSDDDAGPMPVPQLDELQGEGERGVNYGGALLPGEGAAIAQFVQKGLRIPRRGEVGWAGQEIEKLEDSGYVMSGSRHARMNAVRLRKENQVFNAEERRALALIMFEEKQQKENEILGNFRQMLTESSREGETQNGEGESRT